MIEATEPADLQRDATGVYLPSPAEIAEACRAIQAEWSEAEEYSRRVVKTPGADVRRVMVSQDDD